MVRDPRTWSVQGGLIHSEGGSVVPGGLGRARTSWSCTEVVVPSRRERSLKMVNFVLRESHLDKLERFVAAKMTQVWG